MQPDAAALLWDALEAARSVAAFLEGVTRDAYVDEVMRRRAVERELEIIGEALGKLRRVDPVTAARIPGLDEAVGLRNVLIHGYAEIVDERVYDTVVEDIPGLLAVLDGLLAEAGAEE